MRRKPFHHRDTLPQRKSGETINYKRIFSVTLWSRFFAAMEKRRRAWNRLYKVSIPRPAQVSSPKEDRRGLILEMSSVGFDELLLVVGNVVGGKNRIRGAGRNAGAAVNALCRIDKKLLCFFKPGLILLGMDAVGGADVDAEGILDAGIGNYIGHDESLRKKVVTKARLQV